MACATRYQMALQSMDWLERARVHRSKAEAYTKGARLRKDRGMVHPVEDFLFQYYPYPLALLEQWQPEIGVSLEWPETGPLPTDIVLNPRFYSRFDGLIATDPGLLSRKEQQRMAWIRDLLIATSSRPPLFSCHGMHEWAMVYGGQHVRHEKTTPLRLPQKDIDELVRSRSICCTHHDAFRFFAENARPLNRLQPSLETRAEMEQPGCVHANMDLYKWAAKTMPWIGSDLLLDCFELAIQLRDLDMRASPYDLRQWGREPICIETPEGRRVYENEQRRLSLAALPLRERLVEMLSKTLAAI